MGSVSRRDDHIVLSGGNAFYLYWVPQAASLYAGRDSFFLYAIMVPLEAPLSGTSTNPARSFGPAIISGEWSAWWIYWVGPLLGALASIVVFSFLIEKIEEARLYHFECYEGKFFQEKVAAPTGGQR